jgi:hypothetical protein
MTSQFFWGAILGAFIGSFIIELLWKIGALH